ncbi:sulfotransferase 1B1-like isoform X1 [Mytilus californianus]|uniref:sulfotransferase 1B1-like isoform X1 n=1 Tax=Mytilus californianus TaxID=6549 RepID=UPI002245DED3|nr:sulfotransferase 1B1-like isoform X1 [Mytilus californianus]XP_052066942.1 sulfotransferase 1B1-like isoform X1 [Mytilus californianus]
MDMEKFGELMKAKEPGPWPEFEGIRYPPAPPFREKGVEKALQDILHFQSRESDLLICTYPKSGTHWIFEIINMLLRNKTELDTQCKVSTMIEFISDFTVLDKLESPRLLNSHCLFNYLPKKHIENGCKIIHMIRNPKDVCVSLYYQFKKHPFVDFKGSWDDFFEIWMSDKGFYGSWYNYEKEMEKAEKLYPGMILTCYYEKMKKDSTTEIKRLADFLGIQCTESTLKDIAYATSFQNMQQHNMHKLDSSKELDGKGFIYRKGEIGDWKNHFTVAQNERFEEQYTERFKDSTYKLTFE